MADVYFTEMSRFRDQVLSLAAGRSPGRDIAAAQLYVGPISPDIVTKLRDSIDPETFLLIYYSEADISSVHAVEQTLKQGERTLFCLLSTEAFCADKAGVIASLFLNHKVNLAVSSCFAERYGQEIEEIQAALSVAASNAEQSFYGRLIYLRNSIVNLRYVLSPVSRCFVPFEQAPPAVICSAGPSLRESLPVLKKYADRVLIICVYRVLPLLLEAGIRPDFAVQVDPSDLVKTSMLSEVLPPLIASSSLSPGIAGQFSKIIWTVGDSPEFNAMAAELNITLLPLKISHSVTVPSIDFTRFAGCRKIALVGSDLAFSSDGRCYNDSMPEEISEDFYFQVQGVSGTQVTTNTNFNGIRKSIQRYIQSIKNLSGAPSFYNCSEHGAVIDGCRSISLEKFCASFTGELKPQIEFAPAPYPDSEAIFHLLKSQATASAEASANIVKHASRLISYLEDSAADAQKMRHGQRLLNEAVSKANPVISARPFSYIFQAYERQSAEIDFKSSPSVSANDPIVMLRKLIRTNRFKQHFIKDFISDIGMEPKGDLQLYDCLRNIFIQMQEEANPCLAEYLRDSRACRDYAAEVKTSLNLLRLPLSLILPDRRSVYSDILTPGLESALRYHAKKQNREFIEAGAIDLANAAIIYVTAGNFFNLDELRRLNQSLPVMVVMPWAGVVDKIAQRGLPHSFFTDNTTVVCTDADSNWLEFCRIKIQKLKAAGKQIHILRIPVTDEISELDAICEQLKSIS